MNDFAPIVVFGYNRPDHLRRTLEQLSSAEGAAQSDLWLFCDGPKPSASLERIEAVRKVAQAPEWCSRFKSVHVIISETNKGLARSIISGVSAVLATADRVIVIEDDLLVAPDFLRFMNDCLTFYRDDERVGSVTGFCPLTSPPPGYAHDVMAVPRNSSQGWATWVDRWRDVDWDAREAWRVWSDPSLLRQLNATGTDRTDRLRRQLDARIDSWSIRFGLWQILKGKVTIYPTQNRILNIGYDGSGVHCGVGKPMNETIGPNNAGLRPAHVDIDPRVLRAFRRVYSGSWLRSALRSIRTRILTWGRP